MMNVAILMGRLVADPELKHTPSGAAVTSFTLAVDRSYVKSGADRQTDFIDIVAWRSTAEFISKYFRKGQMMAVQGSIQTRSYTDKDGNKRKACEILAEKVSFCGGKQGESEKIADVSWTQEPAEQPKAFTTGESVREYEEIALSDDDLPFNKGFHPSR